MGLIAEWSQEPLMEPVYYDMSPKGIKKYQKKLKKAKATESTEGRFIEPEKKKKKKKKNNSVVISFDKVREEKSKENKELKEERKRQKEALEAKREAERRRLQLEEEKRQAETDVIRLIARRNYLQSKLSNLNYKKRKDADKIVQINIEMNDINAALHSIRTKYGIQTNDINSGSKLQRAWNTFKNGVKTFFGNVKKFFKKNLDTVIGIASVAVPFVVSLATVVIK